MLWIRQVLEKPPLYGDNSGVNLSLLIPYPLPTSVLRWRTLVRTSPIPVHCC